MTYQSAHDRTCNKVFAALADPTRRHIFEALRGAPQTVGQLATTQPVSRPAVSQHLKILESADLVTARPQGTRRLYAVKRDGLTQLRDYLDRFWADALSAYGAEVTRQMNPKSNQH